MRGLAGRSRSIGMQNSRGLGARLRQLRPSIWEIRDKGNLKVGVFMTNVLHLAVTRRSENLTTERLTHQQAGPRKIARPATRLRCGARRAISLVLQRLDRGRPWERAKFRSPSSSDGGRSDFVKARSADGL
jgi:hypothetical protein